jgi:hypothetical protein
MPAETRIISAMDLIVAVFDGKYGWVTWLNTRRRSGCEAGLYIS